VAFIVLGFFAFSDQGVSGGVLEMVNHGLTTGAIFFLVGVIWERRGTLRFSDLGGLQKPAPVLAAIFLVVVMSAVGLPGLNGFVGEFLVLVGTFITSLVGRGRHDGRRKWRHLSPVGIPAGLSRSTSEINDKFKDISWREIGMVAPLLAGIVFLGIYPKPFFDRVNPSVEYLLGHVEQVAPNADVPSQGSSAIKYTVPADQSVDAAPPAKRGSGSRPPGSSASSASSEQASGGSK